MDQVELLRSLLEYIKEKECPVLPSTEFWNGFKEGREQVIGNIEDFIEELIEEIEK